MLLLRLGFARHALLRMGFTHDAFTGSPYSAFLTSAPTTLFSWRFPHEAFLPDGLLVASYVVAVRTRVPEAISAQSTAPLSSSLVRFNRPLPVFSNLFTARSV